MLGNIRKITMGEIMIVVLILSKIGDTHWLESISIYPLWYRILRKELDNEKCKNNIPITTFCQQCLQINLTLWHT